MISIQTLDRGEARRLILEMKGGSLSDDENFSLEACTSNASHTWICTVDNRPVAAWGVVPPCLLSDRAYLWLYCTEASDQFKFMFVRKSRLELEKLLEIYPTIYGVCAIDNSRAIRWIKWLGGEFGDYCDKHVPFVIRKKDV